uniref:40S ribosomal protein S15 n=1 Tax=Euplotes harpa TaxID=151035 RepID=A0A7S3JP10_9SPIT|mmetsp:Transcript_7683/g.8687  ORF Transcript_7683/g.8687 Transcript_7683/m.8687 type:complete len:152 (+) Transcript_7683:33-488(+)|eukprot:CAMPEP_0168324876 /NCGR_PEP_ID=MMETSP0213-20121227/4354_1 /TAXON_ID=151035 /ORGANISM="Euplotes harpa, Strain FSP1.4" /LENGTH=151 /DNA_ID=CAMNT_0008327255 /DNA_START=33 /DNA_END=488 /DNA_ORIENTATION=-
MASTEANVEVQQPVKKSFKKSMYRGVELHDLLEMKLHNVVKLLRSRQRRRFSRGMQKKYDTLLKKLKKAKADAQQGERPKGVKTHLRNAIVLPEMVGSIVEVYRGNEFVPVEVKTEMIGHYLGEFSITYKPVTHGKLGVGATRSSKFTSTT